MTSLQSLLLGRGWDEGEWFFLHCYEIAISQILYLVLADAKNWGLAANPHNGGKPRISMRYRTQAPFFHQTWDNARSMFNVLPVWYRDPCGPSAGDCLGGGGRRKKKISVFFIFQFFFSPPPLHLHACLRPALELALGGLRSRERTLELAFGGLRSREWMENVNLSYPFTFSSYSRHMSIIWE